MSGDEDLKRSLVVAAGVRADPQERDGIVDKGALLLAVGTLGLEVERLTVAAQRVIALTPGFWWTSPPNQATADVMEGIKAFGIDLNSWREASPKHQCDGFCFDMHFEPSGDTE